MKSLPVSILIFVALLFCWQFASGSPQFQYLFGDPISIARIFYADTASGLLLHEAWVTAAEAVAGFLIGLLIGTPLGFLLWYSPQLASLSRPYLLALGALPIFSFAPLVIVWFGIGFSMKVAVAALGVGLLALSQAFEGAQRFSVEQENYLRLLGATRRQMLVKAVIPSSIDWVFNSMKLCVSTALLGAFIGEFISSSEGIGHYMNSHGALYDVPAVFAGGIYLIGLAGLLHLLVALLARRKLGILRLASVPRYQQRR